MFNKKQGDTKVYRLFVRNSTTGPLVSWVSPNQPWNPLGALTTRTENESRELLRALRVPTQRSAACILFRSLRALSTGSTLGGSLCRAQPSPTGKTRLEDADRWSQCNKRPSVTPFICNFVDHWLRILSMGCDKSDLNTRYGQFVSIGCNMDCPPVVKHSFSKLILWKQIFYCSTHTGK